MRAVHLTHLFPGHVFIPHSQTWQVHTICIIRFGLWNLLVSFLKQPSCQCVHIKHHFAQGWTGLVGKLKLNDCLFLFLCILKLQYSLYTVKFTFLKCRVLWVVTSEPNCLTTTTVDIKRFHYPQGSFVLLVVSSLPPPAFGHLHQFSVPVTTALWTNHTVRSFESAAFVCCDALRFIRVGACVCGWVALHPVDVPVYLPTFVEGHLDNFQFLVIMNKAIRNICIQIFVWTYFLFRRLNP